VRAVTNVSLAALNLENFNYICEKFPILHETIKQIAEERNQINKRRLTQ